MSKLSFLDKIDIFLEVSKSSKFYLILIAILCVLGYLFITTNKNNIKRNKYIYITTCIFIITFVFISFKTSISKLFDYMMNNFFIAIYFPNLAIYAASLVIINIIVWISIFNYKTSEIIKRLNIIVFLLMNYILVLILNVIKTNNLDIFTQSSVYSNKSATALIELSSILFIVWIIFLIVYKLILIYLKKDYKPKVKRVIRKVKKLPENYTPTEIPDIIYGNIPKKKISIKEDTKVYENLLTKEDYIVLLKLLKEHQKTHNNRKVEKNDQDKMEELKELYSSLKNVR